MAHKFPIEKKAVLDTPQRRRLFGQAKAIRSLGITAGMVIADIGCGTGFFTVPLARLAGEKGKVFAVDISAEMLGDVRQRAREKNLRNVKAVLSRENKIPLPARTIDYCLLSSVVHEMENTALFFKELKRLLKDKGRIGIIEWKKVSSPLGPPLKERISTAAMKRMLVRNGFRPARTLVLGKYNYGIIADRKERP